MEQISSFCQPVNVSAVYYEDNSVNLIEIVFPESGGLATHVPEREAGSSELDLLNVQAHSRNGFFVLIIAHLKQESALACVVKAEEEHLLIIVSFSTFLATDSLLHVGLGDLAPHFLSFKFKVN